MKRTSQAMVNIVERIIQAMALAALFTPALSLQAQSTTFTNDTLIQATDASYDGRTVVVSNCTLTINGTHRFTGLNIISNATLTHSPAPNGEAENRIDLTINGDAWVDSSSRILANGLGYAAGQGPGAEALAKVKTLSGLLPICSWCKSVRDDKGYWKEVEEFVTLHSEAQFSHGICPACSAEQAGHFVEQSQRPLSSREEIQAGS